MFSYLVVQLFAIVSKPLKHYITKPPYSLPIEPFQDFGDAPEGYAHTGIGGTIIDAHLVALCQGGAGEDDLALQGLRLWRDLDMYVPQLRLMDVFYTKGKTWSEKQAEARLHDMENGKCWLANIAEKQMPKNY